MKKSITVITLVLTLCFICTPAMASSLAVDMNDLDTLATSIIGYTIVFDVAYGTGGGSIDIIDFSTATTQPAVWITRGDSQLSIGGDELSVLSDNFFDSFGNFLANGNIFTVNYTNAILTLSTVTPYPEFFDENFDTVPMFADGLVFGDGDHTLNLSPVNPVPIPPTVLLLGAGLVGLVGIRRRVKS